MQPAETWLRPWHPARANEPGHRELPARHIMGGRRDGKDTAVTPGMEVLGVAGQGLSRDKRGKVFAEKLLEVRCDMP
jgi:hypothetical protein